MVTCNRGSKFISLSCRWFRHITEASNTYKAREAGRRSGSRTSAASAASAAAGSASSASAGASGDHNGLEAKAQADDGSGKPAGRSHSFHEQGSAGAAASPTSAAGKDKEAGKEGADDASQKTGTFTFFFNWEEGN